MLLSFGAVKLKAILAQSVRRPRQGLNWLPKRPVGQAAPNPIDPNAPVNQCLNKLTPWILPLARSWFLQLQARNAVSHLQIFD